MLCSFVKVEVEKDVNMVHQPVVLCHEVPLLMAVFGEGNVRLVSDGPVNEREIDPNREYARLAKKYGVDATGSYHVTNVFGQQFTRRLEEAMRNGLALVGLAHVNSEAQVNVPVTQSENAEDPLR